MTPKPCEGRWYITIHAESPLQVRHLAIDIQQQRPDNDIDDDINDDIDDDIDKMLAQQKPEAEVVSCHSCVLALRIRIPLMVQALQV